MSTQSKLNMKAELVDVSECKKNLDIEVPHEAVDSEVAHVAQEFARRARVPGFRPGKAPVAVVKTRYKDEIFSEVLQHLLPRYFDEAVEERKLQLVQPAHFDHVDYAAGQPLRFKAVFEVYPNLDVSNYVGVPVEEVSSSVDEAEVEASLKRLQEDAADLNPVEESRPIKEGDFVEISFQGTMPAGEQAPISADKAVCEIGGATTLKEFTENLLGAQPGDERAFTVVYRPDYPEKTLAGKAVDFKVKVDAVKEKQVPELNDEFAQRFGDYKTLEELKAKIREDIGKHKKENAQEQIREKILEWLENNNEFEVPPSLVERQLQIRVQRLLRDLSRQGINPQRLDVDWSKIREEQLQQATRDVRGSLILDYISDKENINVSDDEIDAEMDKISSETKQPKQKVREVLTRDSGLDRLRGQIRNRKTLDFLQQRANIQVSH
jgi:trigger factor